jgi:hypothetical protein
MTSTDRLVIAICVLIVVIVAIAVWRRPPARDASGERVPATLLINCFAVIGLIAIPLGFAGVSAIARGQHVGTLMIGLGLGAAGQGAFVLYALFWRLTKRPNLSATLALAIPATPLILIWIPQIIRHIGGANPA